MEYGFLFRCWHLSICDEIIESNSVYSLLCVCVGVFFVVVEDISVSLLYNLDMITYSIVSMFKFFPACGIFIY